MRTPRYTVAVRTGGIIFKVCRSWFGTDGSYYVTAPYHPDRSAFLAKCCVNYARQEMMIELEDTVDRAGLDEILSEPAYPRERPSEHRVDFSMRRHACQCALAELVAT
jgi:hypothetical protein